MAQPELDVSTPVHVTMHAKLRGLRPGNVYKAFHRILKTYLGDRYFRIVHIRIQTHHRHLLVEAADKPSLSCGMHGFTIRAAKAIHRIGGRKGQVFPYRHFAKPIRDELDARNAIADVLDNFRRHSEDTRGDAATWRFDYYSSAASFAHWDTSPWRVLVRPATRDSAADVTPLAATHP